jgi:hypothetical protein
MYGFSKKHDRIPRRNLRPGAATNRVHDHYEGLTGAGDDGERARGGRR